MVKGTIIIFVKAPVPGQVKTRLIPALGEKGASELYRAMAMDTLQVARQVSGVDVKVAYQACLPDRQAHEDFRDVSWLSGKVDWFAQEGKDLGERLIHAIQRTLANRSGPVVVIGSDLPALSPVLLETAFEHLKNKHVVLGPSSDGGYYLIGLTHPLPVLFKGISWSGPKVLRQTQRILTQEGIAAAILPVERDIDTPEDLAHLKTLDESSTHFLRTRRFLRRHMGAGAKIA